jgi:hypothetical protein
MRAPGGDLCLAVRALRAVGVSGHFRVFGWGRARFTLNPRKSHGVGKITLPVFGISRPERRK